MDKSPDSALGRAKEALGGTQAALARAIGIAQQSVSEHFSRGGATPIRWCVPIDLATTDIGKRVSCHELRPDIFPDEFVPAPPVVTASTARGSRAAHAKVAKRKPRSAKAAASAHVG